MAETVVGHTICHRAYFVHKSDSDHHSHDDQKVEKQGESLDICRMSLATARIRVLCFPLAVANAMIIRRICGNGRRQLVAIFYSF